MAKTTQKTNLQKIITRFFSRRISVIGLFVFCLILLLAVFGDLICPYSPTKIIARDRFQGPNPVHIFGTDDMGRDTFARIIDGARLTLLISGGSVLISLFFGTLLGLLAGYRQGKLDTIISGLMDSLWAFPAIVLAMAIRAALGASISNIIIAIGVANIPDFYRIVRSRVISVREMEYITGAYAIGLNDRQIIFRYVLPNILSTLIVQVTLTAAKAALAEASLSFLGLGVPLPQASWGTMLKSGYALMRRTIWLSVFPGIFIMLLIISLNFLGDGLRDALDLRIRTD
jgi:peptide/nickel transport system permease protein